MTKTEVMKQPSRYRPYPEYKDSGIEWLGKIPKHWDMKRIKFVADINSEVLPDTTNPNYAIQYLDIGKVSSDGTLGELEELSYENAPSRARRVVRPHDVIISTVRTYLKAIAYLEKPGDNWIVSTGFGVVRAKTVLPKFLYYFSTSEPFVDSIMANSYGVSYPAINPTDLASLPIYMPSADEQKALVAFLDRETAKIDGMIVKKEKLIELLKEKRQAVITQAVTKGLDPNAPMKDSGIEWLGKIPKHWDAKRLKYLIIGKLEYGANEEAVLDDERLPRYIRITDFDSDGELRDDTFKSLPWEAASDYILQEGDILFARSGATVGKTFQFKNYKGKACFAGYLIKASANDKYLLPDFLLYFTRSWSYEEWKNHIFIQATIQNIGADKYANLVLPAPSISTQIAIINFLDKHTKHIDSLIQKNRQFIDLLKEKRQALISAAVTGKIDVREICAN